MAARPLNAVALGQFFTPGPALVSQVPALRGSNSSSQLPICVITYGKGKPKGDASFNLCMQKGCTTPHSIEQLTQPLMFQTFVQTLRSFWPSEDEVSPQMNEYDPIFVVVFCWRTKDK
jgi:hypothetical protein